MYTLPWSEDEVSILQAHYYEHGRYWSMWESLLPNRSDAAIERKAKLLGLTTIAVKERRKPERSVVPRLPIYHIPTNTSVPRDPSESYVMGCMKKGMTPSEIDKANGWWPGKAKRILQCRWERER